MISAWMMIALLVVGLASGRWASLDAAFCTPPRRTYFAEDAPGVQRGMQGLLIYINYLSKWWEGLDIVLVSLGAAMPISWQFLLHHATTPLFVAVVAASGSPAVWPIGLLNAFHHVGMYWMFAGATSVRPVVIVTGTLQLVVGLVSAAVAVHLRAAGTPCQGTAAAEQMALGLMLVYLVFWLNDILRRPAGSKEKRA